MKPPHALTAVLAAVLLATAWAQPLTSQPVEPLLASPLAVTEVTDGADPVTAIVEDMNDVRF